MGRTKEKINEQVKVETDEQVILEKTQKKKKT